MCMYAIATMDRPLFLLMLGIFCVLVSMLIVQIYRMQEIIVDEDDNDDDDDSDNNDASGLLAKLKRFSYDMQQKFYHLAYDAHVDHIVREDDEGYMYD